MYSLAVSDLAYRRASLDLDEPWSHIGHMAKTATAADGCKCLKIIGGAEGDRTPDLRIANAALCQTELLPHDARGYSFELRVSSFEFSNPQSTRNKEQPQIFADKRRLETHA